MAPYRWFLLRARAMPGPSSGPPRCIGTLSDITATRRAQDQLLSDAVHDRVTGLPNRALLVDRIEREISAAGRIAGQQSLSHADRSRPLQGGE